MIVDIETYLGSVLCSVDREHRFATHTVKLIDDDFDYYDLEYTFTNIRLTVSSFWKCADRHVQRELMYMAIRRAYGDDVPMFGTRCLAYAEYRHIPVSDIYYKKIHDCIETIGRNELGCFQLKNQFEKRDKNDTAVT